MVTIMEATHCVMASSEASLTMQDATTSKMVLIAIVSRRDLCLVQRG